MSIAAASVLAKTYRDEYMDKIHEEFPMYNWKKNKGYPTKDHREAIAKYGITKYHRMSFRLLPEQFSLKIRRNLNQTGFRNLSGLTFFLVYLRLEREL